MIIRNATEADFKFILETNEHDVEVLAPMDEAKLELFMHEISERLLVVEVEGRQAAFLIAIREGNQIYQSENYRWFCEHYDSFLYVDRIVIAEGYRGQGVGRALYEYLREVARAQGVHYITAEIDTVPYNGPSLKFHEAIGFREVGTLSTRGGAVEVSLQELEV